MAQVISSTVQDITKKVADKITELNGGKSVSAVFVVGGGGKAAGFVEQLAGYLELPKERVALRGAEVMNQIEFLQKDIKVDSLLVTPVGICLNYYEQKNNFIFVSVNGERIKMYDNSRLTVIDAAMQVNYPNEDLFPKRGKALNYKVNGESRMRRGKPGEASVVRLNGQESNLNEEISSNDQIEITASTVGEPAELTIQELSEYRDSIRFVFNKKQIQCPKFVRVNGELVSGYYDIREGDQIEIVDYYTLEQILEFMDIVCRGKVYVNNAAADMQTKVYDNFSVACEILKEEPNYQQLMEDYGEGQVPEAVLNGESQEADRLAEAEASSGGEKRKLERQEVEEESYQPGEGEVGENDGSTQVEETGGEIKPEVLPEIRDVLIQVNGEPVTLSKKKDYILVDVLDFYPFDLSEAKGDRLETLINGVSSQFTDPLKEGDEVQIFWTTRN